MNNKRDTRTITVGELIDRLGAFNKDLKVYTASDEEGNSYGTLDYAYSLQTVEEDNVLVMMPYIDHLDDDDITPNMMSNVRLEMAKERACK